MENADDFEREKLDLSQPDQVAILARNIASGYMIFGGGLTVGFSNLISSSQGRHIFSDEQSYYWGQHQLRNGNGSSRTGGVLIAPWFLSLW
ncbi:hypothetical protein TELCIR_00072 [Teladorsagia circumcincta]|uniref:Uncharacterized protein n=1 Tax=Teladorsagia circumcincta TaxID=45464 RepID=A0A2G9V7S3_TELCI|nr:hypothetical protein TELCIR_00072 [Teladorsagia circumcincta]